MKETETARWIAESSKGPYALSVDMIESYIIDLVQMKCEEQREKCSRQVSGWPDSLMTESEIEEAVRNAPEPEIG